MVVKFFLLRRYDDIFDRYIHQIVDYNALCWAADYEVVGDDNDLYIIENLDPEEKVVVEKNVEDGEDWKWWKL